MPKDLVHALRVVGQHLIFGFQAISFVRIARFCLAVAICCPQTGRSTFFQVLKAPVSAGALPLWARLNRVRTNLMI